MTPGFRPLARYLTPCGDLVDVQPIQRTTGRTWQTRCVCRSCGTDVPHRGENRHRLVRDAKRWARTHSYTCPGHP